MSWFDTAGFASLAKTALKEAQKTIDKALDINEDESSNQSVGESGSKEILTSSDNIEDSFFSSWGLNSASSEGASVGSDNTDLSPSKSKRKMTNSTSLWGSFTGSFFDNPSSPNNSPSGVEGSSENKGFILNQPKKSSGPLRSMSLDLPVSTQTSTNQSSDVIDSEPVDDSGTSIKEEIKNYPQVEVVFRKRESVSASARNSNNRLSVISSESDRRSTDSCDVLGSTPDSEPASVSTPSFHKPDNIRHSGSFESSVELVTSPSSIEIIPTDSSPLSPSKCSSDSVSPISESVGCEEEEISDSYTSLSETVTMATVVNDIAQHQNVMHVSTSSIDTSFSDVITPRDRVSKVNQGSHVEISHKCEDDHTVRHGQVTPGTHSVTQSTGGTHSVQSPGITISNQPTSGDTSSSVGSSTQSFTIESNLATSGHSSSVSSSGGEKLNTSLMTVPSDQSLSRLSAGSEGSGYIIESSSCDDTLMGSSGEQDIDQSDEPTRQITTGQSLDVSDIGKEAMLAEAMADTASSHREHSPISSDRSDLVKIGSSGHTSADELETATSSDIEIISSPATNGDSSSTVSRQSANKTLSYRTQVGSLSRVVTSKGHNRQPSEASSGGSEEGSEVDRLLKRISEMTEILEARESKLIDLSRLNASLQETNSELKSQLEYHQETEDVNKVREEFTQRLTSLERKFQQSIRDKDQLKKQLDQAKKKAAEKEEDIDKDELITELRNEGEKLSKQQLLLNNTIKKLRANEKETTKTISSLKEQVSSLTQELERCKKSVNAKEDMERSHIEAVHNLTKQKNQLDKELEKSKQDIQALTSSIVSLQKELTEKELSYKELETKRELERRSVEKKVRNENSAELEAMERQVSSLQAALEDMQSQLLSSQHTHSKSESALRRENKELMKRLENSERRCEEATQALTQATKPLTKQIYDLSQTHQSQIASFTKAQQHLNNTISDLENKCASLSASERSVREQYEESSKQLVSLQSDLNQLSQDNETITKQLAANQIKVETLEAEKLNLISEFENQVKRLKSEYDDCKRELKATQEILSVTKAALEAEKRKVTSSQQLTSVFPTVPSVSPYNQEERMNETVDSSLDNPIVSCDDASVSSRSSPTLAPQDHHTHKRNPSSLSGSHHSNIWPNYGDEGSLFDSMSSCGRIYDVLRPSNTTTYLETLQSQLKLREGELAQLQIEVMRLENERTGLSNEVVELSASLRQAQTQLSELSELRTSYDALLQMYGEKLEQNQELQMDLDDVKHMYKQQIEELLGKKDTRQEPSTVIPTTP